MSEPRGSFWTTPNGLAAIVLIGIAGYYLLAEHQAHVFAALPWLVHQRTQQQYEPGQRSKDVRLMFRQQIVGRDTNQHDRREPV